jgi:hypothetical protein
MDVTETKLLEKCCSKCKNIKTEDKFIPKRNICKECRNTKSRENYTNIIINNISQKICSNCNDEKQISEFHKGRTICCDCINSKRRIKYQTDEEHRKKLIKLAGDFKHNKVIEKQKLKEFEIGIDNTKCSNCNNIKPQKCFRYNRLKCKDCERDEPLDKFKRVIRSRIISALSCKNKHTIEYLGCNSTDYLIWILNNDKGYTLENRGSEWHIDHVIPLSHFDLDNEEQQQIAFNWRNTMALSAKENLSKNNKIIKEQIEQHYKNLVDYHNKNNLELPIQFIDLFAKHLDDGNPLKLSLPL